MSLDLSTLALGWIAAYGAPMVAGILFLVALGMPFPGTLLVIASGAFMRLEMLNVYSTPVLAYVATIVGDILVYGIAYFAGTRIKTRYGETTAWEKSRLLFERRGGIAIFLTRWLFTALALPVTLIAGSSGYRFSRFLLYDVLGELTWVLLFGSLGYALGSQWELISDFISNFSGFALGVAALGAGVYLLVKFNRRTPAKT